MKILAIDTTGNACSAAIVANDGIVAELFTNIKKNHSVMLMPMIDNVFSLSGMNIDEMDYIAVTSGPGSFTGLRIGVATAKALAHASFKKIVPVPTLDALAYTVHNNCKVIVPIMDARRNQVYTAFYRWDSDIVKPFSEYIADDITRILNNLHEIGESAIFTGDAVSIYSDLIMEHGHQIAPLPMRLQRASSVGALALKLSETSGTVCYDSFVPFYLRRPQAEREYEEKIK